MPGSLTKYAFITAKLRTRLSKILSSEFLDRLMRAPTIIEAMQLLRNTDFADVDEIYEKTGDLKMGELSLWKQEIEHLEMIINNVKGEIENFCRALLLRYEIDNLKNILRLWFDRVKRKRVVEEASGYIYRERILNDLHIEELLNAEDTESIVKILSDTPFGPFIEDNRDKIQLKNSLFSLEIALDKYYYTNLLHYVDLLSADDAKIAHRFIGVEIDMLNINWIVRFKTLYNISLEDAFDYMIPFGYALNKDTLGAAFKEENVTDLVTGFIKKKYANLSPFLKVQGQDIHSRLELIERILEEIMRYEVRRILMGNPFNVGIILADFILKKWEIKRVMTILNAKLYGIEAERIKVNL